MTVGEFWERYWRGLLIGAALVVVFVCGLAAQGSARSSRLGATLRWTLVVVRRSNGDRRCLVVTTFDQPGRELSPKL